jgi:hypothetical protein
VEEKPLTSFLNIWRMAEQPLPTLFPRCFADISFKRRCNRYSPPWSFFHGWNSAMSTSKEVLEQEQIHIGKQVILYLAVQDCPLYSISHGFFYGSLLPKMHTAQLYKQLYIPDSTGILHISKLSWSFFPPWWRKSLPVLFLRWREFLDDSLARFSGEVCNKFSQVTYYPTLQTESQ